MSDFETNEMEIQEIRRKILNSDSNIKKKLIDKDNLKEISDNLKKISTEEIKKIINSLCVSLGDPVEGGGYSFPSAERILEAGEEGLAPIRAGFRVKYILDAAQRVASGNIDLEAISSLSYEQAEMELMRIKGVGKKVASCVLLFGYGFLSAFPIDVWVKRVIEKYYDEDFDPLSLGEYAGIAQQYLFYRERYLTVI